MAVAISAQLRRQLERRRRHERHQRQQRRSLHSRRGGGGVAAAPVQESGNQQQQTMAELFAGSISLPAKSLQAHALAGPLTGLLLCCRYDLLELPRHQHQHNVSDSIHLGNAFTTLWVGAPGGDCSRGGGGAGLATCPTVPSAKESEVLALVERWRGISSKRIAEPYGSSGSGGGSSRMDCSTAVETIGAANDDEIAALYESICVPFLCAFWGLAVLSPTTPQSPLVTAVGMRRGAQPSSSSSSQSFSSPFSRVHPMCGSAEFLNDISGRLLTPLPWALLESYLQLSRLPPSAAGTVRAALLERLVAVGEGVAETATATGKEHTLFSCRLAASTNRTGGGGSATPDELDSISLSPHLVESLRHQLSLAASERKNSGGGGGGGTRVEPQPLHTIGSASSSSGTAPPPLPPMDRGARQQQPPTTAPPTVASPPPPPSSPTFDAVLAAARASGRVEILFHLAQAATRAIFSVLMPALSSSSGGGGSPSSGRMLAHLAERARWGHRHALVLGSLESFVSAFEDVFFTLRRRQRWRLPSPSPTTVTDAVAATASSDPSQWQQQHITTTAVRLDESSVAAGWELDDGEVVAVSAYTGPVGPWLLYGRVVCCFFPPELPVPLGVMAEGLGWGHHYAGNFGDLPSCLAAVGRQVRHTVVLPLLPQQQVEGASALSRATATALVLEDDDRLFCQQASWLLALHSLAVGAATDSTDGTARLSLRDAAATLRRLSENANSIEKCNNSRNGALNHHDDDDNDARGCVAEAIRHFPLILHWDRSSSSSSSNECSDQSAVTATAPYVNMGDGFATQTTTALVDSFVECYVCPLLRNGAPPLPVASLAALLGGLSGGRHGREQRQQHPLLRRLPPIGRSKRNSSGGEGEDENGKEEGSAGTAPLMAMLWGYTSPAVEGVSSSSSSSSWMHAPNTVVRSGRKLSLVMHLAPSLSPPSTTTSTTTDVSDGSGCTRPMVVTSVAVCPAGGYRSPQDHLLTGNGLTPCGNKINNNHAAGTASSSSSSQSSSSSSFSSSSRLFLRPGCKPVSLFELVAQSEALASKGCRGCATDGDDDGVVVEAVVVPGDTPGSIADIIVWSAGGGTTGDSDPSVSE